MLRLVVVLTALVLASCATTGSQAASNASGETMEKMVVSNMLPFDVASCGVRPLQLGAPSAELIQGALLSIGPMVQECFVDRRALEEGPLEATLRVTVGPTVAYEVVGRGVSASGKECLVAAAKRLPFKPLDAGATPVTGEVPIQTAGKSVVMGINQASDVAGAIRLAQPSFCSCYAELGQEPAPVLAAKLTLSTDKPVVVSMEPSSAPAVSACVAQKVAALALPQAAVTLPYQFLLTNSYASGPTPGAQPALQFQQLDGVRAQRTADVLLAVGQRGPAGHAYDALVAKYKSMKPEKSWQLIPELKAKCGAIITADDAWLGALKELVSVYDASLVMAQAERAKDPAWAPVEEALAGQRASTAAEFKRVEGQRKADEGACPKSK